MEIHESAQLYKALQLTADMIKSQKTASPRDIVRKTVVLIKQIPGSRIDYLSIVDPGTLEPVSRIKLPVVVAAAVWVGKTRLIDNILVK